MARERIKTFSNGYKVDKRIMQVAMLVVILFALFIGLGFDNQYRYFKCGEDSINFVCDNPFYGECDDYVCEQEFVIRGGSLGEEPPVIVKHSVVLILAILAFAALFNDLIHNKRKIQ